MQEDYERELIRRNDKTSAILFLHHWRKHPNEEEFKNFWDESSDVRKIELIHQMSREELNVILLDYRCFLK